MSGSKSPNQVSYTKPRLPGTNAFFQPFIHSFCKWKLSVDVDEDIHAFVIITFQCVGARGRRQIRSEQMSKVSSVSRGFKCYGGKNKQSSQGTGHPDVRGLHLVGAVIRVSVTLAETTCVNSSQEPCRTPGRDTSISLFVYWECGGLGKNSDLWMRYQSSCS